MSPPDVPGRGTAANPPNRYEPLHVELEPDPDSDAPPAPTVFYRDTSRTILAENDSPDIGFRFSLNPYRGCEHGCIYCAAPDAPILYADMAWRPIGNVCVGDVLFGFDEFRESGRTRKFRPAVVEAVWWSRRPTLRLVTERTEIVATAEHRWLQDRNFRWSQTRQLAAGRRLRYMPVVAEDFDDDYRLGYLAGMTLGDGTFRYQPGWRSARLGYPAAYGRVALADQEPLLRLVEFLARFRVEAHVRPFHGGSRRMMEMVHVRSLARLAVSNTLINAEGDSRSYRRGFLAGFFDAEGHNGDSLRLSQVDVSVLERVRRYAAGLGFAFDLEPHPGRASTLRLTGRLVDRIRFFSTCRPDILRKIGALYGCEMNVEPESVLAVEPGLGDHQVGAGGARRRPLRRARAAWRGARPLLGDHARPRARPAHGAARRAPRAAARGDGGARAGRRAGRRADRARHSGPQRRRDPAHPRSRGAGGGAERELGAPPPPEAGRRALRALARGAVSRAPRARPRAHPRPPRGAPQRLDLRPPPARPGRVRGADRGALRRGGEAARARPAAPPTRDRSLPTATDAGHAALASLSSVLTAAHWTASPPEEMLPC